ncbi:MAG: DUF2844 domain-containing protein [Steroidobacteraceae bacterium]
MNPHKRQRITRVTRSVGACIVLFFGGVGPALAHLGGAANSVDDDRIGLQGELRTTLMQQFAVHVITAASGTIVREYASPDDKVFAISWHGPTPPDLRTLLGEYFTPYLNATTSSAQTRAGSHRQVSVSQSDLVVQAAGHARSFRGRAFVPSLVPAGVLIDALP